MLSSLQDEETPIEGSRFNGSDESKSLEQVLAEYDKSHPSIIDKLFSGKLIAFVARTLFINLILCRDAKNHCNLWQMQQ